MAQAVDYLHTNEGDLIIENGDWKKGEAGAMHERVLLFATKGSLKQFQITGVGLREFLLDNIDSDELRHLITEELEADGFLVTEVNIEGSNIEIESTYR